VSAWRRWQAYGLLLAGMSVVGIYVAFSKVILATVPVLLLGWIRFGIAAVVMLPWTFPKGSWHVVRGQWSTLFLLSFFGNFMFSICMLSGVARTSATAAGLIMSMLPAVVALFSVVLLRERLAAPAAVAIGLAVLGVSFLTVHRTSGDERSSEVVGNLFMVGAVCCEALYVVLGKRLTTANVGPMQISAWINLVGFTLMSPFGLWQARSFEFSRITTEIGLLIAIYAVAASVLSTWLWLSGLKTVPANRAGVFTIALPISSATVGVLFLGERLGVAHLVAFFCAALGLILVTQDGFRIHAVARSADSDGA
jgi:drug/metabolite transporter (DMT)-like permease